MKRLFSLVLILLTIVGCTSQSSYQDELLSHKKPFLLPEEELETYFLIPTDIDIKHFNELEIKRETNKPLDNKQILEDLVELIFILRNFYGRYSLNELQFEAAFENIKNDINSNIDFKQSIVKHFSFVKDYHLQIDGHAFYSKKVESSPHNSIDLDGNILLNQTISTNTNEDGQSLTNLSVPYFHLTSLENPNPEFDAFIQQIKSSKISILDLRNNLGGRQYLPGDWFKKLTGEPLVYSFNGLLRQNPLRQSVNNHKVYTEFIGAKDDDGHYSFTASDTIYPSENLLIVLQNHKTSSSAELLIDYLHHYQNTIFIGTNTAGIINSNMNSETLFLPNSQISVSLGDSAFEFHPDYYRQEYGFSPDYYVLDSSLQKTIEAILMKLSDK